MENLFARMEQYNANLEDMVAKRNEQLLEEQGKMEHLLHELLPKYVKEGTFEIPAIFEPTLKMSANGGKQSRHHSLQTDRNAVDLRRPRLARMVRIGDGIFQ